MRKIVIIIAAVLLTGLAVAALRLGTGDTPVTAESDFDANADIAARITALEQAVSAERDARQMLEEEVFALYDEIDALESAAAGQTRTREGQSGNELLDRARASNDAEAIRRTTRAARGSDSDRRRARLEEAGFSPAKAEWIIEREAELRMEAMQARYEAMRSGEPISQQYYGVGSGNEMRAELGDAEYETYLEANNRPTAIEVASVFESSPARTAGLQAGDQITHYDGERTFSVFDMTRQSMEGSAGENVVVNIIRDGVPMQVVIPRGPLGINTGRRR
jgi:hypothetical protein